MKNIWRIFGLLPNYRGRVAKVIVVNGLLGLVMVASPLIYRTIINGIITAATSGQLASYGPKLAWLIAILFLIQFFSSLFNYIQERQGDLLSLQVLSEIRWVIFQHLAQLSIDFYERERVGEIIQRVQGGVMELARWTDMATQGIFEGFLIMVFITIFLLIKLPFVGIILLIAVPATVYLAIIRTKQADPIREKYLKEMEKASGHLSETVSHMATVRAFGQEKYKLDKYFHHIEEYRALRMQQYRVEWRLNFWRSVITGSAIVIAIGVTAWGVVHGHNTVGDILLASLYIQQVISNTGPVTRLIINSGDIESAARRLTGLLDETSIIHDEPDAVPITKIETIEFDHVSFMYSSGKTDAIQNVSFKLQNGQTLALVGPSGSGKTTITKLLLRFYRPTSGTIRINGQPIEHFTQASLRQAMGMVMQDVALFNDTVEENIRFARPDATTAEVQHVAAVAHADAFIQRLPEKYDTLVGERGIKLSGGEKQRVAIARAILRSPSLIILDEATSALDSESERFVQLGLTELLKNRTAVVIAHRLSTVRKADIILVLKDGKVVEEGDHDQLVKNASLYAKLYQLQVEA